LNSAKHVRFTQSWVIVKISRSLGRGGQARLWVLDGGKELTPGTDGSQQDRSQQKK